MLVILGLGVGAYFGGGKVHQKMLASKSDRDQKQLERMNLEIQQEYEHEKRWAHSEKDLLEAERELNAEFGWDED